jgi:hypothetical protein
VGDEACVLSLFVAKFRALYCKQFLDKRCGIGKNCWLIDDHIWEEVWVMLHCCIHILQFMK